MDLFPWGKHSWSAVLLGGLVAALGVAHFLVDPVLLGVACALGAVVGWWFSVVPGITHTVRDLLLGLALAGFAIYKLELPREWWPYVLPAGAAFGWLVGCLVFPKRRCWWCGARRFYGDGSGNLRDRGCWRCGGKGTIVRAGRHLVPGAPQS